MEKQTVTVLDIAGIQQYVFDSNNLKHIVGASGVVHAATHDWVFEHLAQLGKTNVIPDGEGSWRVEPSGGDLTSEVIYAGGGNIVILFAGTRESTAREFTKAYTQRVMIDAPGLQPVITHAECDLARNSLAHTVRETFEKVNLKKNCRRFSTPLLGISVTATCDYTGLPAVDLEPESDGVRRRISANIKAKLAFYEAAEQRLKRTVGLQNEWRFVRNFDEIGTPGKSSYMAVIHTDGNSIGTRIVNLAARFSLPAQNRDYITQMRDFSSSIDAAAKKALQESIRAVIQVTRNNDGKTAIGKEIEEEGVKLLPVRPIVFGGDDATIVCDGRLGLTFAELYLRELTVVPLSDTNQPMSARAGIVVVKTHHPFARAVAMASELAVSAKKYITRCQQVDKENGQGISAMDWHFAAGGAIEDIEVIRAREYTVQMGDQMRFLNMRPVRLGAPVTGDWHAWDVFRHSIETLKGPEWNTKRNKIMALREALREGPDAVKIFRDLYKLPKLPSVPNNSYAGETGWIDNCCTCFDAIEALDFFTPLREGDKK